MCLLDVMALIFAGYRTSRERAVSYNKYGGMVTSRITLTALSWCCFQMGLHFAQNEAASPSLF